MVIISFCCQYFDQVGLTEEILFYSGRKQRREGNIWAVLISVSNNMYDIFRWDAKMSAL